MPNTSEEASKIDANKEKVRHTNLDLDAIKPGNTKIEMSNHDNAIERGKEDNKNGLKAPEIGTIDSKVTNTHTDDCLIENDRTSLEIWLEPKGWPNTNEHKNSRIQPAGNYASTN